MITADLYIALVLGILLLLYNPIMATIVFNRLFPPASSGSRNLYTQTGLVFTISLLAETCSKLFEDPGLFIAGWAIIITIVFIAQWLLNKISQKT